MGTEFLNSYIKMVDGEKDPRNLLLLFSVDRVILLEFEIESHIEVRTWRGDKASPTDDIQELFDITFCYFPIAFRPPPNDPYGITADDLKTALRRCMSASPHFAKMALPLFLEKFATATGPSMVSYEFDWAFRCEVINLRKTCCYQWQRAFLFMAAMRCVSVQQSSGRASRLKCVIRACKACLLTVLQVLYSSDTTIEASALSALESLVGTLYPTEADTPVGLAQDIVKQCSDILQEPEKSQGIAATKVLAALVRASRQLFGIWRFS